MSQWPILYANPASQPSKAVYWACLINELAFELHPDFGEVRTADFAQLNPKRQLPTLVDGDFALYEMPAILGYLCDKHGWEELYPKDLETRARISQYLHFHHSSTRCATFKLMAPHVMIVFDGPRADSMDTLAGDSISSAMNKPDPLADGQTTLAMVSGLIEQGYFPGGAPYLCGTTVPTIADLACYEELAQLSWADLFDFSPYTRLSNWLEAMSNLPFHKVVHRYNLVLGDIRTTPNTMDRFIAAIEEGLEALDELPDVRLVRSH